MPNLPKGWAGLEFGPNPVEKDHYQPLRKISISGCALNIIMQAKSLFQNACLMLKGIIKL